MIDIINLVSYLTNKALSPKAARLSRNC